MDKERETALHTGQFASIIIMCNPGNQRTIEEHFKECGISITYVKCFEPNVNDQLAIVFNLLKEGKEVAKSIMSLFNRNAIEIGMITTTADGSQKVENVKLRRKEDIDACERLLEKCAQINIKMREINKSN